MSTTTTTNPTVTRDRRSTSDRKHAAFNTEDHRRLHRVERMSQWMDNRFRIPGTSIRFGLDSVVGLVPGVGDSLTAVASGWILNEAYQAGVPRQTMVRMVGNVAVDLCVGAIPLVGDVFDIYWKANVRNTKLLQDHLSPVIDAPAVH